MKNAKSIICILFPFKSADMPDLSNRCERARTDMGRIISGDVWLGEDYHIYIKRQLNEICRQLKEKLGGEYMPFCDTGPLVDKEIAARSGLCKYGRNSLAINPKLGSFFYIGYILTDVYIEGVFTQDSSALFEHCAGCGKCVNACPTGALSFEKPFNYKKCVSYLSQKKGELTEDEAKTLGNTVYGCHICQNVCPANKDENYTRYVDVSGINISNKEFKKKYGDTAACFIGKNTFVRNSIAVMNNSKKGS